MHSLAFPAIRRDTTASEPSRPLPALRRRSEVRQGRNVWRLAPLFRSAIRMGVRFRNLTQRGAKSQYAGMENPVEKIKALGVSDRVIKMHLQGILHDIAHWADTETALKFAIEFGGKMLYLPKPDENRETKLKAAVGYDVHCKLYDKHAGNRVEVLNGPFSSQAIQRFTAIKMLEDGHSISKIANTLRVSRSSVHTWRRSYVTPFLANAPAKASPSQEDA